MELLPFDNDLHSDLFKLFILASNELLFKGTDYWSIGDVHYIYSLQLNDRTIAPVEYEGYIDTCFTSKSFSRDTKIKYTIEE